MSEAWPAAEEALLREKTAAGFSAGWISKNHLPHRSRNAVVGKIHRLGIRSGRDNNNWVPGSLNFTPKRRALRNSGAVKNAVLARMRKPDMPLPPTIPDKIEPKRVGLLELNQTHCRWCLDEKGEDGLALFCGHDKWGESSYCLGHSHIVYMRSQGISQ